VLSNHQVSWQVVALRATLSQHFHISTAFTRVFGLESSLVSLLHVYKYTITCLTDCYWWSPQM